MTPDRFPQAFDIVVNHEGGYQNDPRDPGNWTGGKRGVGELKGTKYGVSAATFPHVDIRNLTLDVARQLFRQEYWTPLGADRLPAPLALVAFDTAIHSGVARARSFITTPGDWRGYLDRRLTFLEGLAIWPDFGRGWTNRINRLRTQAQSWEDTMGSETDRQILLAAAVKVARGTAPKRYSPSTITEPGRCAQLVRETVEIAFGLEANKWEVASLAFKYQYARKGDARWAKDYRDAARELGLQKPVGEMRGGDILYWPYTARDGHAYGHTAMFIGDYNGVPCVLENSDWKPEARRAQGAWTPLGAGAQVFVTPLSLYPTPDTVITPTRAIQRAEADRPAPAPRPTPPAPAVTYVWAPVLGTDGTPEPGLVSVAVDGQGRLLLQPNGKPKIVRVEPWKIEQRNRAGGQP